ncbi:MAG TPA: septal ring lytic transglycosylase RlpA family protein [Candidatus Paceibacterota bacterium]|nr:septal ring lytic transglycosylase RlpA family protein [Candidatus Paceibacterota bacterium]
MKTILTLSLLLFTLKSIAADGSVSMKGVASWYGEAHRGKPMANRQPFDPDKLTAASWFYPLGTKVRVATQSQPERSVIVTITDRGPARRYVRRGRVIDLAHGAFAQIAPPKVGLVPISIAVVE